MAPIPKNKAWLTAPSLSLVIVSNYLALPFQPQILFPGIRSLLLVPLV